MTLTNPTDDELNAAFAEKVAGYVLYRHAMEPPMSSLEVPEKWCYRDKRGIFYLGEPYRLHPAAFDEIGLRWGHMWARPAFTRSADAVLPWLSKHASDSGTIWTVTVHREGSFTVNIGHQDEKDDWEATGPFPRAAVIALLRAHGVEVIFNQQ